MHSSLLDHCPGECVRRTDKIYTYMYMTYVVIYKKNVSIILLGEKSILLYNALSKRDEEIND
jgi:hypothetical protein